jgi:hypothetical protein
MPINLFVDLFPAIFLNSVICNSSKCYYNNNVHVVLFAWSVDATLVRNRELKLLAIF